MDYISRLKGLSSKATPGPWEARDGEVYSPQYSIGYVEAPDAGFIFDSRNYIAQADINAELIAEMRNSLDLWLELAEECELAHKYHDITDGKIALDRTREFLAKLKGHK